MSDYDVVVIGASWGGLRALEQIFAGLPEDFPIPIVVAQHRDDDSDDELLARLLNRHTGAVRRRRRRQGAARARHDPALPARLPRAGRPTAASS